jgi:hypothetical protein
MWNEKGRDLAGGGARNGMRDDDALAAEKARAPAGRATRIKARTSMLRSNAEAAAVVLDERCAADVFDPPPDPLELGPDVLGNYLRTQITNV